MGDFNMTPNNPKLRELIADHDFFILISEPTCFKSVNPTCIYNFLTNKKTRFKKTLASETGVSDHRKHIGTMLRSNLPKEALKKCFTIAIETMAIKSLKKNNKNNHPQCQILNHFNLHLNSF